MATKIDGATTKFSQTLEENVPLYFGINRESEIRYDGTNMIITPALVDSGHVFINGAIANLVVFIDNTDSPYTAGQSVVILCNTTGGAITVNLPDALNVSSRIYHIKKTDGSANAVTVSGYDLDNIDGDGTKIINIQYDSLKIVCDGAGWNII